MWNCVNRSGWRQGWNGLLLLVFALPASAADYALSPDGNTVVRVVPQTTISSASFNTALLTGEYPGWTVSLANAAGGVVTPGTYTAGWQGGGGGAMFTASYSQTNAVAAGHQLHWVQVIDTNQPAGGTSTPYIDPRPNDDTLPFYWTTAEVAGKSTSKTVSFSDFSRRPPTALSSVNPVTWNASLYAVEYDGNNSITVHDGVSWGWNMKPATVGNSGGVFASPSPTCPPATCSGIGTSAVSWGLGDPGSLSFAATAFAPVVGDLFKVGTLTYHNGATQVGSAVDALGLDIALNFTNVTEANLTYHSQLSITNTPNTDDPVASADFVRFTNGAFSNTFNVVEGGTATADLMARLTPVLGVTPALVGGGDKDPNTMPGLAVLGFELELIGFANATAGGFVTSVIPEPATMVLWMAGLFGLGLAQRRRGRPAAGAGAGV
ncbi:PEP-CTERM protein-sorting domain-containing protein [Roseateles sp. YR242]|uniref:choice-of-anchor K domain-containing protein n=1 Tax=Roseateles sp. YR242 TaxID=1855305 RepID=UPI0008C6654F|nr:choice-of-anchor K domain-containing protein [Roseateles sp. YR242]SEL89348.1 PEP-CTERM protein-sorting domain-containing protein [Roseateles sp. YR242]